MKSILLILLSFGFVHVSAQSSEPGLDQRLDEYMRLNREMRFVEMVEYVHPSLFTLVPKDVMVEKFEKGYDNEGIKIIVDSISVTGISPLFVHNGASYHKVDYFMGLQFYFKDEEMMKDSAFTDMMTSQLGNMFPQKKVAFSTDRTHFIIAGPELLMAIKDDQKSKWMFLTYGMPKSEALKTLFPKEVAEHFRIE